MQRANEGGTAQRPTEALSYAMFGACIEVQRRLQPHCVEVNSQRALELALRKRRLEYLREAEIPIGFDDVIVTRRWVDFVVWDGQTTVLLEIKAAKEIRPEDLEQSLLHLRHGDFRICDLASFGETPLGKMRRA